MRSFVALVLILLLLPFWLPIFVLRLAWRIAEAFDGWFQEWAEKNE